MRAGNRSASHRTTGAAHPAAGHLAAPQAVCRPHRLTWWATNPPAISAARMKVCGDRTDAEMDLEHLMRWSHGPRRSAGQRRANRLDATAIFSDMPEVEAN